MYKHIGRRLCTVRNNGRASGFFLPALVKNAFTFRKETDLGEKSKKTHREVVTKAVVLRYPL